MTDFREYLSSKKYRPSTVNQYVFLIDNYLAGKLNVKGISKSRRTQIVSALKAYVQFKKATEKSTKAEDKFLVDVSEKNVTFLPDGTPMPTATAAPTHPERPLDLQEWQRLYNEAKNHLEQPYKAILCAMLKTGLRVGDIGNIRREWIIEAKSNGAEVIILQPKGGKFRHYPWAWLKDYLEPLLKEEKGKGGAWEVVYDLVGHKHKAKAIYDTLKRVAVEAGLDATRIHPHLIRKTVATQILDATGDIDEVKKMLGHASITTTQIYVRNLNVKKMDETMKKIDERRMKK